MSSGPGTRQGLLVDWGGVLTTSPWTSFSEFAVAEGLPADALRAAFGREGNLHDLILALERGTISDGEFERECAAGLDLDPARAEGLRARLFRGMRKDHEIRRAVFALRRSGVRTGLLSNSVGTGGYDPETVEELFDVAVISRDVGVRKPDPEIYEIALERLGMPGDQVVFVDDLRANLPPAEALGIATVLHREAAATVAALEDHFGVALPAHPGSAPTPPARSNR